MPDYVSARTETLIMIGFTMVIERDGFTRAGIHTKGKIESEIVDYLDPMGNS